MKPDFPHRAVHIDFHTMPGVEDFAADFDAEAFADTLKNAHVQYVNLFAKCNLGFCYFPTQVGTPYPTMKIDLFGQMLKACHDRGIGVSAYFNVGLSHEQALRHREWCTVNQTGQVYAFDKMDHWFRTMCFNSDYKGYILALVEELLQKYPVDGLIFDSMNMPPCYGVECIEPMLAKGLDPDNEADMRRHTVDTYFKMQDDLEALAKRYNPSLYRYYLGIPAYRQPTHQEMEILPQGGWGYDYMPWYIRYIRTLGRPFSLMTGRFQRSWGDISGLRPQAALEYDCYYAIAHGANLSIGDHLHPRGKLNQAVYQAIGDIYSRTEKLEKWTASAHSRADMLVVTPQLRAPYNERKGNTLRGFARMLTELKYQFDVTDGVKADFSRYSVILLPDSAELDEALSLRLEEYLQSGGKIVSMGLGGVDQAKGQFSLPSLRESVDFQGVESRNYTFIHPNEFQGSLPLMEIPCYQPGIRMQKRPGAQQTQEYGAIYDGYFQFESFEYGHEYLYIPERAPSGFPALTSTKNGQIWHFATPLGESYYNFAPTMLRDYFANVIKHIHPDQALQVAGLPSFATVSLMEKEGNILLHVLNFVPEKRGRQMEIIEDRVTSCDVKFSIKLRKDEKIKSVTQQPEGRLLPFEISDGRLHFCCPRLDGYALFVIDGLSA